MSGVRDRFGDEHRRLNGLFYELANALEGASQPAIEGKWVEFEGGLMAHLEAEEQYVLPLVEQDHPGEVQTLLTEHEHIRQGIARLGTLGEEQRAQRREMAAQLLELLQAHADHERDTLYRWADEKLAEHERRALLELLCRETERRARQWTEQAGADRELA